MLETFKAFISSAAMLISVYTFGIVIFGRNKKINMIYKLLLMLISVILYTLIYLNFDGTLKTILSCIMLTLTFKYVFNSSVVKSLLSTVLFLIILIIPDLITLVGSIYLFHFTKEQIYNTIAGGILSNISVSLLMLMVTYVLRKPLKKIININISSDKRIIITAIITIVFVAIFFYKLL